ncbi:MAG: T9SS type A sorting domain-containing protein [Bacteroidetes bacterium]|nr:T9SS type A sorting domain-containing protein [Bacteroidota bacterium]MBK9798248.1 T9SS type A sorting domain-containing protein [Bacteroidota bacterium]MBP6412964.1 T9SS type A sorting domain-containing protein [Bacteroidia bacterium]
MRLTKLLIVLNLITNLLFAQGLSNNWLLGYWYWPIIQPPATSAKAKIDFFGGSPLANAIQTKMIFNRTQANISDSAGNLLMSSNGIFIANTQGDTMLNGAGLNPDPLVLTNGYAGLWLANGNVFLPYPGDSNKYILFHQSVLDTPICCNVIMYYSIIDLTLDGGLGAVIQKNTLMQLPRLAGGLTATKHANGRDWWILVAQDTSNTIWKILLTSQGITSITSQVFPINLTFFDSQSQACFSPDGTKYAFTTITGISANKYENIIRFFNFDRCSGNLSELSSLTITDSSNCFGLTFSPNSKFLYACSNKVIYQLNTDSVNVASSIDTVALYDGFQGGITNQFELLYRANDNKIYISTYGGSLYLGCITAPDSAGSACNVQQHSLSIPCYNTKSVPNHPNYFLGAEIGSPCDTLLGVKASKNNFENGFTIAPNPAKEEASVYFNNDLNEACTIEILNSNGILIDQKKVSYSGKPYRLVTSSLANGVYFLKIISSTKSTFIRKLIIVK